MPDSKGERSVPSLVRIINTYTQVRDSNLLYFSNRIFIPLLPQLLPLHLVHEVEVRLVEVVDTDVTVLTTGGIGGTGGVHIDGVEGTEVAADTADLVFEDLVVETSLEFTLASRGGCDIHGGLTTTQNHVVLLWGDSGGVEGSVGGVGLHDGEVARGDKLDVVRGSCVREMLQMCLPWRSCLSRR